MLHREARTKYHRLSDVCHSYLTPVVFLCFLLVLLSMVPHVVAYTSGLVGSTMSFCVGLLIGIAISVVFLVVGIFLLTKKFSHDEEKIAVHDPKSDSLYKTEDAHHRVHHPNIMKNGHFASHVWIVAASNWNATEAMHKFPPRDPENKGTFHFVTIETKGSLFLGISNYYAELKDDILRLSCVNDLQKKSVLKMELEGCVCRLVTDCLGTKSLWWRKGPLEISHPTKEIYRGEQKFFMFCAHGADKEQWYVGLHRYLEDGEAIRQIQSIYRRFSKNRHQKTNSPFSKGTSHFSNPTEEKVVNGERAGWFAPWRRGNGNRMSVQNADGSQTSQIRTTELAEEIDHLWSVGKISSEETSRKQLRPSNRKTKNKKATVVSPPSTPSSRRRGLNRLSQVSNESIPPSVPSEAASSLTTSLSSAQTSTTPLPGVQTSAAVTCADQKCSIPSTDSQNSTVPPTNGQTTVETQDPTPKGELQNDFGAQGIYGLNMLLNRWSFDLARSPDFESKFRASILKKLSGLKRPDYVTPLTIESFDMGSNFPQIRSIRSLPPQDAVICPELLVDIAYSGGLEMTVETSVDLREGAAWGTLDRALTQLHGQRPMSEPSQTALDDSSSDTQDEMEDALGEAESSVLNSESDKLQGGFSMRRFAAMKAKQFAERTAEFISNIPLRLSVKVVKLEGTLLLWIAPPPSKRLWISFLQSPSLEITAKPILGNRVMKYSAWMSRVSVWLQRKIKASFFNNLVFPNCTDLSFPGLLGLGDVFALEMPISTVMKELENISEHESDECEIEKEASIPQPVDSRGTVSGIDGLPDMSSCDALSPRQVSKSEDITSFSFPIDDRLETIRHSRFETRRLNSLRHTWVKVESMDDSSISRKPRRSRSLKISGSFSEGDMTQLSPEQQGMDDEIMSDCVEFFDPDSPTVVDVGASEKLSQPSETKSASEEDKIQWPSKPFNSQNQQSLEEQKERLTQNRGFGHRIGDLIRNIQTGGAEDAIPLRRRSGSVDNLNPILKAARQKAEDQKQRLMGAFENRKTQLGKLWTRKSSDKGQ